MDWSAAGLSFRLAFWTCLLLGPVAVVAARWLAMTSSRYKPIIEACVLLPLVLPPTVLGYYLLVGLAPDTLAGAVAKTVMGGPVLFTFTGIVLASLIVNLPFAIQPMQRAFEAIPQHVREAAWTSGLSRWETFRRIELPLAWPGLVSALALVTAHTLGEFGVLLMVGGNIPGDTRTLSIAIYDSVQAFRNGDAAVMALFLLTVSFVALLVMHVNSRRV